jgi:hypothetical protein
MPHVDELLGITTLASMGLLVAVSLQPVEGGAVATESAVRRVAAATHATGTEPADAVDAQIPAPIPAATAKAPT